MASPTSWYGGYSRTATAGKLEVETGIDLGSLPVPAIKYRIRSGYDYPIGATFAEVLPDGVEPAHVGFRDEFGSEDWYVYPEGRLVWSRTLDPGEEVLTLFGVWLDDPEDVLEFLDQPNIEAAVPLYDAAEAEEIDPLRAEWGPGRDDTRTKSIIPDDFTGPGPDDDAADRLLESVRQALGGPALPAGDTGADGDEDDHPENEGAVEGTDPDGEPAVHPVVRAGRVQVDAPTGDAVGELVRNVDAPISAANGCYHVRVATVGTGHGAAGGTTVLQELTNAMDVLGSVFKPGHLDGSRDVLDVALSTSHEPTSIVASIMPIDGVEAIVVTDMADFGIDLPGNADDGSDSSGTTDGEARTNSRAVTDTGMEWVESPRGTDSGPTAAEPTDTTVAPDGSTAAAGGTESKMLWADEGAVEPVEAHTGRDDRPAGDAMDEFAQLQQEIEPAGVDELEAEFDDLSLPGVDPEEEVGLRELIEEHDDAATNGHGKPSDGGAGDTLGTGTALTLADRARSKAERVDALAEMLAATVDETEAEQLATMRDQLEELCSTVEQLEEELSE